ncbi:hypothetical protein E2C01_095807 [Portunus trituberculatus]|uniref:Uncharacterized protein n=1 Tax=Portunus trituberculatus TaxID=210409 RepID=A0A5B7JTZ9_PORTR|nr:hypothetical protein [Portunus trituberculatus]
MSHRIFRKRGSTVELPLPHHSRKLSPIFNDHCDSFTNKYRLGLDIVLITRVLRSVLQPPLCGVLVRPSGLGIS